jgi:16S rRNA (cytosine967-C5)-methyltransferase
MVPAGLPQSNNRAIAALAVDRVLQHGRTLEGALQDVTQNGLSARDLSQVRALCFGGLRWHHRNRLIITALLQRPLRARDRILEALLSVGLFQLEDARRPAYATVSATVEASKLLKKARAAGLINAALRRYQRERDAIMENVQQEDEGRYSHPQWLIDLLRRDWPDHWHAMLLKMLEHPPLWVRVNSAKQSRDDYAACLNKSPGVGATTLPGFEDALRLDRPVAVADLPGFSEGQVSIQDAASQLAAELLAAEPGMRVLDACAAPGGKATHLLERTGGKIRLLAVDLDESRNALLRSNLDRSGFSAEVRTDDVLDIESWFDGELFDRILLDAPCSATGVIRRHPDIKFLRRAEDIPVLAERQGAMLEKLWSLLKPGGRLLYSTCSLLAAENSKVVSQFLRQCADAREIRVPDGPLPAMAAQNRGPGYQLLPGPAEIDGFYYALMERQSI